MRNGIKHRQLIGSVLILSFVSTLAEASSQNHITLIHILTTKISFVLILMVFFIVGYALWARREQDFFSDEKPYYQGAIDQCSWIAVPAMAMILGLLITDGTKITAYSVAEPIQQTAHIVHPSNRVETDNNL